MSESLYGILHPLSITCRSKASISLIFYLVALLALASIILISFLLEHYCKKNH
ncbi:MAG: hypothetical protein Q8920_13380 [Bacillota bacterium]|nr:hypothetical protein [Bacillota bacterium]